MADLIAVMRDGLAEGRHDERRAAAARGWGTAGLGVGGGHATSRQAPLGPRRAGCAKVTGGGYSRPESSDVGRSAYSSAKGRGTHDGGGRGGACALPLGGRAKEASVFTLKAREGDPGTQARGCNSGSRQGQDR